MLLLARVAADDRDRRRICRRHGVLAAAGHRVRRHDEPDLRRCERVPAAGTDGAGADRRASPADRAVRALQRDRIACRGCRRAGGRGPRHRGRVDRLRSRDRDAGDVRGYGLLGLLSMLLYRPLSPAVEAAEATPTGAPAVSRGGWSMAWRHCSAWTRSAPASWCSRCWRCGCTRRSRSPLPPAAAILFWSGVCSAISYLVAVPIAERIGLINTMVFTHLPSNVFLMLIPFAPNLADGDRPAAGAQRAVADGCADAGLLCHGRGHAGGAAGGGEHHRRAEDLRLGGGFDDLGLSADGFRLWLAAADRRRR